MLRPRFSKDTLDAMNRYSFLVLVACCAGGSAMSFSANAQTRTPPGTEDFLDMAFRTIEAYQNDDANAWSRIVCKASTNEKVFGLAAQKSLGKFSSVRLVSVSSVSQAGNSMNRYQWPSVAIEVHAENYPGGNLLLTFVEDKKNHCVGVIY
jgi:hypothetical protein